MELHEIWMRNGVINKNNESDMKWNGVKMELNRMRNGNKM